MKHFVLVLALMLLAGHASAQTSPTDRIVRALEDKGYVILLQERTWLGRERLIAENDELRRELVFNPGTGEILRDYAVILRDGPGSIASDVAVTGTGTAVATPPSGVATPGDLQVTTGGATTTPDPVVGDPVVSHEVEELP